MSPNGDGSRDNEHFDLDVVHGFIDASSIAHGPELHRKLGRVREF